MADKLEVLPGAGLVARFEDIAIWTGPQASAALQNHLVGEARRVSQSPNGADDLASSLVGILQRGDPEPQAPFVVVGPGANGLTLFMHGPVQAWDSGRWLSPQPVPGWMLTSIGRPWPLIVLAYGAPPPPPSPQGSPLDLMRGVVPGSGFVILRPDKGSEGQKGEAPAQEPEPRPVPAATGLAEGPAARQVVGAGAVAGSGGQVPSIGEQGAIGKAATGQVAVAGPPSASQPAGGGAIDLRNLTEAPVNPLRFPADVAPIAGGQQQVLGVSCDRGHFNHPRASRCLCCGRLIPPGSPQITGTLPTIGVLLGDDGSIWALDRGCFIGTQPELAQEVQSGLVLAIALRAGPNNTMVPVQAEIQVRGWDVYLVDRGTDGGTWIQPPGSPEWSQLARYSQRDLPNGTHISCGGRVLTYLAAWPN